MEYVGQGDFSGFSLSFLQKSEKGA